MTSGDEAEFFHKGMARAIGRAKRDQSGPIEETGRAPDRHDRREGDDPGETIAEGLLADLRVPACGGANVYFRKWDGEVIRCPIWRRMSVYS